MESAALEFNNRPPGKRFVLSPLTVVLECLFLGLLTVCSLWPFVFIYALIPLTALLSLLTAGAFKANYLLSIAAAVAVCVLTGGDLIYIVLYLIFLSASLTVFLSGKIKSAILAAGLCLLVTAAFAAAPIGIACGAKGVTAGRLCGDYGKNVLEKESGKTVLSMNPVFQSLAESMLTGYNREGYVKPERGTGEFNDEAKRLFSDEAYIFGEQDLFYDVMNFASLTGAFSYLFTAVFLKKKRLTGQKETANADYGGFTDFKELRLNRKYFLFVFLPLLLFSFFGYIEALSYAVASVVNAFSTVPAFFAALTLFFHTGARVTRVNKKPVRITLYILTALLGAAGIFYSLVRLIVSVFGTADSLLDVRRLLDYALGKSDRIDIRK